MALVINDRVKENSTTSGTGNITRSGQGNETFNKVSEQVTRLIIVYLNKAQTRLK